MARTRSPATRSSPFLISALPGLSPEANVAFREKYVTTGLLEQKDFVSWRARLARYSLLWAFFEGTAYSDVHTWAKEFRKTYGIYTWTRNVFNAAFRLGEFWTAHLMGGALDPDAGDGKQKASALPIATKNEAIRPAIGRLWADSVWQTKKDIWTRWGATLGDAALIIFDDALRQKVYLRPISPAAIRYVDCDYYGNVKGYMIEEVRRDPEFPDDGTGSAPWVSYTEKCVKDGEEITFSTFRQGSPYDWQYDILGDSSPGDTWTVNYGFVPMVLAKHLDVGAESGWAEFQPALPMIREIDDLCCVLTDQARRILNAPWIMNARKPSDKVLSPTQKPADEMASGTTTEVIGRDRMKLFWNDPQASSGQQARPFQLVGNMPMDAVGTQIDRLVKNLEKFYPELQIEGETTGDSGRARRVARQKAEAKVHARRAAYDDALARAQMMALSMGGKRRGKPTAYPGYEAFTAESFTNGDLAHSFIKRPVFATDPMDDKEEEQSTATVMRTYKEAGVPVSVAMKRLGFDETDIDDQKKREEQADALAQELATAKAQAQSRPGNVPADGSKPPAQEVTTPQNRGAAAATDLQSQLYARPPVPFETRSPA